MAVFGLFATYVTCASRPDVGAPLASTEALFATYWLLFETFDLFRLRRSTARWTIESFILPINAFSFLALSIVKWQRSSPEHLYGFFAAGAALYLASALLRARLRPPSTFDQDAGTLDRIAGGSYEGPITLSAAMAAAAILLRASGEWINLGLLIEGEILFLAGFQFGQKYLRQLAGALFAGSVYRGPCSRKYPNLAPSVLAGRTWTSWSPIAALSAAVFYFNRMLRVSEGALYSTAAAGLIAMVLAYETPLQYLSVAWLAFAALLFEIGFRWRRAEFRYQCYLIGALGTGAGFVLNSLVLAPFGAKVDWPFPWLPLAICAALHYAATLRISLSQDDRLSDGEKKASWITAASAVGFLFVIVWKVAPADYLGAAWLLLGALMFELGLQKIPEHFRWLSYFVSAAGFWNLFWVHVLDAQIGSSISEAISLAIATVTCCTVSARIFRPLPDRMDDWEREWCRDLYAGAGCLFAMTLVWLKCPPPVVALVWTALGLTLFEIGVRFSASRFRLLGHLVALRSSFDCLPSISWDWAMPSTSRIERSLSCRSSGRTITSGGAISMQAPSRVYLYTAAVLFAFLARFELGPTFAIVAWALFGLALFAAGQLRKIVDLRGAKLRTRSALVLLHHHNAGRKSNPRFRRMPGDRQPIRHPATSAAQYPGRHRR